MEFYADSAETLTGAEIRGMMRAAGVTIRQLSRHMQITQKRIRYVREHGIAGYSCCDFRQGIWERQTSKGPKR